jgi:type I restriction enzyme S subunit
MMPVNSVLIALTGATTGRVGHLRLDSSANQSVTGIIAGKNVDARYLFYWLKSIRWIILEQMWGGGQPHISQGYVKSILFPLAPYEEQERIAAILDKTNDVRNLATKSQNIRNRFLSSVFLDIFGDSTIEETFPRTTIDEISVTVSKGTTPMTHGMDFVNEGIPFLRVQDLVNNPIVPSFASKAIDESTHDFLSRSQLKINDILISIAGTIGRISIVPKDSLEMNCNQAVAFIRLSETSVLRHCYLMYWLNSRDARLQMAGSSVTATISNLSLGKIKQLKIPVPPLDLQLRFEKIWERFDLDSAHHGQLNQLVGSITQEILT